VRGGENKLSLLLQCIFLIFEIIVSKRCFFYA
jgi:hypothetical protein